MNVSEVVTDLLQIHRDAGEHPHARPHLLPFTVGFFFCIIALGRNQRGAMIDIGRLVSRLARLAVGIDQVTFFVIE
jgi:hypothetical protein